MKRARQDRREFEGFARRAMRGVHESAVFLQLFRPMDLDELVKEGAYVLQLGAAVLLDRPFVVVAPIGAAIPEKLRRVADSIEFYNPADMPSLEHATRRALEAAGVVKH